MTFSIVDGVGGDEGPHARSPRTPKASRMRGFRAVDGGAVTIVAGG
jgi:hypothetical protein